MVLYLLIPGGVDGVLLQPLLEFADALLGDFNAHPMSSRAAAAPPSSEPLYSPTTDAPQPVPS